MTHLSTDGKKVAVASMLVGILATSLKRRHRPGSAQGAPHGPAELSRSEWKEVFIATKNALGGKNLSTLAAGIAYYSTLSLFPMLAAAVAVAALLITPDQLNGLIDAAQRYLPEDISGVVASQLQNLVGRRTGNILAAIIAIAVALFGASGASKNLVIASNIVFDVRESRGWLAQQIWGIIWTVAGIAFGFFVVAFLAVNASFLGHFGVSGALAQGLLYGRWVALLVFTIFGLSIFYKYGPNRPHVHLRWVVWGAAIATIVWLVATLAFFVYVQNFANYTKSYSLFAGIIALMIWMNLSALIVLLGAEINHQLEVISHRKRGGFLSHLY